MPVLREDTLLRCCHALIDCDEFANHEILISVFTCRELSPYSSRLPQAANINDRVHITIEYLLRQHRDAEGRWVILSFLRVLRDRYEFPHGKRQELENIGEGSGYYISEGNAVPIT